jgi:tetratricopeptide (TPR) repeat protein
MRTWLVTHALTLFSGNDRIQYGLAKTEAGSKPCTQVFDVAGDVSRTVVEPASVVNRPISIFVSAVIPDIMETLTDSSPGHSLRSLIIGPNGWYGIWLKLSKFNTMVQMRSISAFTFSLVSSIGLLMCVLTSASAMPAELSEIEALNQRVGELLQAERDDEAAPLAQRALALARSEAGEDHPVTAASLVNLAQISIVLGNFDEGEALLKRAIAIREKTLGVEHPDTVASIFGLAETYSAQNRYDKDPEPHYRRALAAAEKIAPEEPGAAEILASLAAYYHIKGRDTEAEPLINRALPIFQKTLGPDDSATVKTLGLMGLVQNRLGRYAEAETLFKRALTMAEARFGPEADETILIVDHLMRFYITKGRRGEELNALRKRLHAAQERQGEPNQK